MVTKKHSVDFAVSLGWSKADAERAYKAGAINYKSVANDDEYTLILALASFAGSELFKRQALQAAQKAAVTKKKKEIKKIKQEYTENIRQLTQELEQERSLLVSVISRIYDVAKRFGMKDPWIEALLSQYHKFIDEDISVTEAELVIQSKFVDEELSEIEVENRSLEAS